MKKMKYIDSLSLGSTLPTTISNLWSDLYAVVWDKTNYAGTKQTTLCDVTNDVREKTDIFEKSVRLINLDKRTTI